MEIRPLTGDQQRTLDLVKLADAASVFYQRDLDHTHRPWLVSKEDKVKGDNPVCQFAGDRLD